jgi:hypothetical protein
MTNIEVEEAGTKPADVIAPWESPSMPVDPADPRRRRRIASAVALEAIFLGLAGDGLLRTEALGINFLLWNCCAAVGFVLLARMRGEGQRHWHWAFVAPVLFFAGAFAWRDAGPLLALNMVALLSAYGVLAMVFLGTPGDVRRATVLDYIEGAFGIGLSGFAGAIPLIAVDGAGRNAGKTARRPMIMAAVRGVAIAIPILLVFGALLSSADLRFERIMHTLFDVDTNEAIGHLLFAGFIAWVTAGYLRGALVANGPLGISPAAKAAWKPTLGIVELGVPLAALNVLFALFVALQLPYLFGGAAHLQQVAGLTLAEYARRGFFELLAVAGLLLPLMLAGSALVKRNEPRHERTFRWLASVTLGLLAVMMISALQRMRLYTQSFGLTEDRIYATAGMLWLAAVFALFAFTALRGRSAGFALGALLAGWTTLGVLDVANPHEMIVRTNVERAAAGAELDAAYVGRLSADAVPALVDGLQRVSPETRCQMLRRLDGVVQNRATGVPADWRWWNVSRSRAYRLAYDATADQRESCPAVPAPQK